MTYFTKEFIDYFRRLSRNNKREWFHAHKTEYEQHVKSPFNDFVAEIIDRMSLLDPEIDIQPHGRRLPHRSRYALLERQDALQDLDGGGGLARREERSPVPGHLLPLQP